MVLVPATGCRRSAPSKPRQRHMRLLAVWTKPPSLASDTCDCLQFGRSLQASPTTQFSSTARVPHSAPRQPTPAPSMRPSSALPNVLARVSLSQRPRAPRGVLEIRNSRSYRNDSDLFPSLSHRRYLNARARPGTHASLRTRHGTPAQ